MPKIGSTHKNPAAVELGRLGGLKGGPARANKLSSERRSEIARTAAISRWGLKKQNGGVAMQIWTKRHLNKSEALLPTRGSLMPFLRFTKEGNSFDHTTWFRNTLFASAPWGPIPGTNGQEKATIDVDVTILGKKLGVLNLTIDYKPKRQQNHKAPTVHLHYDPTMIDILQSTNVIGHRAIVTSSGNSYSLKII